VSVTPAGLQPSSVLVSGISGAFGVGLLQVTGLIGAQLHANRATGSSVTVALMLNVLAWVFIVIAVYVGAVVTANTFSTIVAGRARQIALLRLLGSTARRQRTSVARQGLLAGIVGTLAGAVIGTLLAFGLERLAEALNWFRSVDYDYLQPGLLVPLVTIVLTTWLASWIGSRRVLSVTPLQAIGGSQELSREEAAHRPGRNRGALALLIIGFALLLLGVVLGFLSPIAILIGVLGGILSFTGLVLGADLVMPPALRLVGRWFGRSAPARLAAENALRHPQRSSRATIGLVIGVTLITMFSVATSTFAAIVRVQEGSSTREWAQTDQILTSIESVFSVLIGFSALIAAVGLVNNLSLSVLQRTRELGLLRALGFSVRQLRRMILTESAQLTVTAVVLGLLLGTVYGWAGAQSLMGAVTKSIAVPAISWPVMAIIVGAGALLTAIASFAPTRRATRVTPVTALAVE
jgi:putative ABC transport system permease protein